MKETRISFLHNDLTVLLLLALVKLVVHTATNGAYGLHRDELAMLDDARHLAWGYVAYPPLVPILTRIGWELFGAWLPGMRLFSVTVQCAAMVLVGLMAKELGGGRGAQVVAAVAAGIAPMSIVMGTMFQYISFDYFWWVLIAYFMIKRIVSGDARWWIGIGAAIGLGMMTKYTIIFLIAGVVVAVLITPLRQDLKSRWLWVGVVLSFLIFLPTLMWHIQSDFIALEFTDRIRARDIEIGRADGFIWQQFVASTNPITVPLWVAGLVFLFVPKLFQVKHPERNDEASFDYANASGGRLRPPLRMPGHEVEGAGFAKYRALGWMFVIPAVLFAVSQGRFYYLAPAFPMLLAVGAVVWERRLVEKSGDPAQPVRFPWLSLGLGTLIGGFLMLPVHPVGSATWDIVNEVHDNFAEMIGWPELVAEVAEIYQTLPDGTGILARNYGEAGAVALYGPEYGLPTPISGMNSFWARGYGNPPPERLIVLGFTQERLEAFFKSCTLAGQTLNPYGIENEETRFHPDIFVCEGLRMPWEEFWAEMRAFG